MLFGLLVFGLVAWLAWRMLRRNKKGASADERGASALDTFVTQSVARAVAQRSAIAVDAVMGALGDAPEPETVGRIEELVRDVEVSYEKVAPEGPVGGPREHDAYDVRVRVRFEDGTTSETTRRSRGQELPKPVRDEFLRTGSARVFRGWDMPWARSG